ncbi:MAG TPA: tetratricopeptide repeat protein, partial [Blastocatellia bacterium]|nr:tetratricopeptide repeat protein [Blastocatellia bacterium]
MKNRLLVAITIALTAMPAVANGMSEGWGGTPSRGAARQVGVSDGSRESSQPRNWDSKATQQTDKKAEALQKYLEAKKLDEAGNYTGAVDAYKDAISLDPTSAELKVALGSLYLKNRNFIDGESQAKEAIKLAPDSADARKLLASVYVTQTFVGTSIDKPKAESAIKELEEVVKTSSGAKIQLGDQEVPALAVIGEIYIKMGDNDKALDAFKRLAKTDAGADKALLTLAGLYYQMNKFQEAADTARLAYAKSPSPQVAALLAKALVRTGQTQEALD